LKGPANDDSRFRIWHVRTRRHDHGQPAWLRRHAADRQGRLGTAERPGRGDPCTQASGRRRGQPDRHGGLVRTVRRRAVDLRGAAPVPRRPGDRHQGRSDPRRPRRLAAGRTPGVSAPAMRVVVAPPRARTDRAVPAAPDRPQGPGRRVRRRAQAAAGGGKDPPHRALGSHHHRARRGSSDRRDRVGPEPLQPRQPQGRGPARPLRGAGDRVHPVVPAGHRPTGRFRRPARHDRPGGRREPVPAGAGMAVAALAGDAPDPRHVQC
jgi:hypothetical protein